MKKTITWVLIADGAQARVLENCGPGKGLKQVDGFDFSMENLQGRDIVTDKPGRSHTATGRSSMEPRTNPVDQRETEFVKNVAQILDREQQKGSFHRLVIAAAPIALGDIRKAISPNVKKMIVAELDKDLTNLPTAQLDRHFESVFAV